MVFDCIQNCWLTQGLTILVPSAASVGNTGLIGNDVTIEITVVTLIISVNLLDYFKRVK
jgi:hypothetical protein